MSYGERRTVAVVLDGPATPAWQARALDALRASSALELVDARVLAGRHGRPLARRLLASAERRLLRLGADALAPVPLEPLDPGARAGHRPAELVVWLSEQPVAPDAGPQVLFARHDGACEPAETAFDRAVLDDRAVVHSEVLLARGDGARVVVEQTVSGVRRFSATLGVELMLWKLAAMMARAAERAPGDGAPTGPERARRPSPSAVRLLAHAVVAWARILSVRLLFVRPWSVRVRRRGAAPAKGWSGANRPIRFRPGHVYADPLLIEHEGRHHLFCEEIVAGEPRGVISHTELPLDGAPAEPPEPVLRAAHHLSYPFVFAHEGELFMIPETSAVRRVELYRALEFPHRWRQEAILLADIDAADATLLAHGELLWLFASVAAPHASSLDELHLFSAERLIGPWRAHPRNPVVSDARCARPAGAVQRWGERLVRPGQDGSRRYGGAVTFREIDRLSATEYAEHEIARLEPADLGRARATHTYSSDARFEAVDQRTRRLRIGWRSA
jgi:hypothetical protein